MAINLGVRALLGWVNSMKLSDREVTVSDLQDGTILLKLVYKLKKESNPSFSHSTEERFKLIADFVERDCRFSATNGTSLSWDRIKDGYNLTVEIAKMLLLLVYHDMMNDRCTLNTLECDMEREIANLTGSFVMESEGCVYLSNGLEAYLARRHLPVSREIFERSATASTSNASTISSLSEEDSPVFQRTQKITFVDMQTVASSSVSKSPLQDIMNTPKFQMRKMQRQMIKERDYRDGLERELASKIAIIAKNESHINQLQYRLGKLKEDQGDQEQVVKKQITDLESKNNMLQMCLDETLKQNKDLKSTSSLMERKVDELTEENGVLSSQMRAVCSKVATFEAEVGRLSETQASSQEEWASKTRHLHSELNQATVQKELLTEQIQILQGKISCLEDEISKTKKEEVGENMGPIMERLLETEINGLKNELEGTIGSLKKAEVAIEAKTHQLAEYQQEITQQKELLEQQKSQAEEMIQAKDELLEKLQKDITEQRAILQQEIMDLKLQLEQTELRRTEQMSRLQEHIAACEQEIEKLKETKKEKEGLLQQTEERVKDLETKLAAANSLLDDKEQQINCLKEEAHVLTDENKKAKEEIQAKENMLAKLLLEKSNEEEVLHNKIQTLTVQIEDLTSSLKQAEQEIQHKQDLLARTQQENIQQRDILQQQVVACEEEVQKLNSEIHVKNEQLVMLKSDSSQQAEILEQELKALKGEVESLTESLRKAEEQVQSQLVLLHNQEQESSHQKGLLEKQLSASEDRIRRLSDEIQAKEEQMVVLNNQSSEQSEHLEQEIFDLKKQVDCLTSSLRSAEENLQSQENLFAKQQLQNTEHMETLHAQLVVSEDEVKRLNAEIDAREEQLVQLKTEASADSELLQQEVEGLNKQIHSMNKSLDIAKNQVQAKEELIAKQEQENTSEIEALKKQSDVLEEEVYQLRQEIRTKEGEVNMLKVENGKEADMLKKDIQTLKFKVSSLSESLKTTKEQVQAKENLLSQKELEISQEKDTFQNMLTTFEEEIQGLRENLQSKEEELVTLKKEGSIHSDMLQQEICCLKNQLDNMVDSLKRAEEKIQTQLVLLNKQEEESVHQKEVLQQQLSDSANQVRSMREDIQAKEEQMILLRTNNSEQSDLLNQELQSLKKHVKTLHATLKKAEEDMESKEDEFAKCEEEIQKLKESQSDKTNLLLKAEEKLQIIQTELSTVKTVLADKDQHLNTLREDCAAQADLVQKAKEEAEANKNILADVKEESSKQTDVLQHEILDLRGEVNNISLKLQAKEQMLLKTQQESAQQINLLQQQLILVNAELDQHKENHAADIRLKQDVKELHDATLREKETLVQEKEVLLARIHQAEKDGKSLEKQLEAMAFEKERLTQAKQAIERENLASRKLESLLQQELEVLKLEREKLLKENEKIEEIKMLKRDLQEQLSVKSEAAEHYKAQMEKAASHYNDKKQLLQESQQEVAELKHSLDIKESEVKAFTLENKVLQRDLEKAQTNEKKLLNTVASLKAQLANADHILQTRSRIHANEGTATDLYLDVPNRRSSVQTRVKRAISSDSLDQSSLEDSLNNTRKLSAPDESSTPLVRSSERLAAKRRSLHAESLETLYFTPISTRQSNRMGIDNKLELDSALKNPSSSVKRRRTTQVINITLTKKTPGSSEGDESFYSLVSARSHPNLSSAHSARPVSMEPFDTPARMTGAASDQLSALPGYRRSAIHSQSTNTFCVGAENEPDGAPEDWMRIAELQNRNKACPPHLKSSYPVESETGCGSVFAFTDEELRTGDPSDTIRRASTMPGQLQDSIASHRHSLMMGQCGANTRSHRMSLIQGQQQLKTVSCSQMRSPRGTKRSTSTLSVHQSSPEKKVRASCFPRPLTPKNKNVNSGSSSYQLHPALSPAERRQSMVFTIDNTPKSNNYLKKGLNKLRSSTRKSPGKSAKKSPARKYQENMPLANSLTRVARASKAGSFKSPQVATKGKKSPQTTSRTGKSPGLTASARKVMMRKMKM